MAPKTVVGEGPADATVPWLEAELAVIAPSEANEKAFMRDISKTAKYV